MTQRDGGGLSPEKPNWGCWESVGKAVVLSIGRMAFPAILSWERECLVASCQRWQPDWGFVRTRFGGCSVSRWGLGQAQDLPGQWGGASSAVKSTSGLEPGPPLRELPKALGAASP